MITRKSVGNRKRHTAFGVPIARGIPESQLRGGGGYPSPGLGGAQVLTREGYPSPVLRGYPCPVLVGGTPFLSWLEGTPVLGYPPPGTGLLPPPTRPGLGYPLERTWNQMLGYPLERTWGQRLRRDLGSKTGVPSPHVNRQTPVKT